MPVHYPTKEEVNNMPLIIIQFLLKVFQKLDPTIFAQNVRMRCAEHLGVPTTDHTFEDMVASKAIRSRENSDSVSEDPPS